ncbi:uncharacterized protein SPSC_04990 [Sporisorium scitamineum]|uniref:Sodium/calcium exchanger membrane region domain-containing protein n=1 Tax=Sporisorium scitamineum TaxID=49012 RepID=A0A0F7S7L2_9BASI|nr:uncharacterized protein SPSC_04990 [Sporisorium scitamineum]CDW97324.1 hypothetical protein [Sporisorium scitamineum]
MAGNRHGKDAWLVFAFLIVVQIVCFRGSQRLRTELAPHSVASSSVRTQWYKRQEPASFEPLKHGSTSMSTTSASSKTATSTKKHHSTTSAKPQPTPPSQDRHDEPNPIACQPIPVERSPRHVCKHVVQHCTASGHFDYLRFYYCVGVSSDELEHGTPSDPNPDKPRWQPGISALRFLRLLSILVWMLFLFSWVGVVASDFFCPNLSTIASRLGLNESTAGVTFLAFGNGSPDVFSTFGAMKTNSGSLAIGELLGAASFIVSVISGSMMLIAPFKVKAWPFCRDVGFFTVAVALTLTFLFDGKLRRSETIALICLYLLYAATVIVGSWWQERRRKQKRRLEAAREEYDSRADNRSILSRGGNRSERGGYASLSISQRLPSPSEYDPDFDPFEDWANRRGDHSGASTPDIPRSGSRAPSVHTPGSTNSRATLKPTLSVRPNLVPRHSLLSAIEFRDVVQSLCRDAIADRSQEIFQSWDPEQFLAHHHHSHHHMHLTRSASGELRANVNGSPDHSRRAGHNRVLSLGPSIGSRAAPARSASTSSGRRRRTVGAHDGASLLEDSQDPVEASGSRAGGGVEAGSVDDPWREHLPGDACEPLISPALPLDGASQQDPLHETASRKALPRLEIPQWDTKASRSEQARRTPRGGKRGGSTRLAQPEASGSSPVHKDGLDSFASQRRVRPTRTASELLAWKLRVIFNALFPSLHHLHAKSLLGAAISVATLPAILLLNLTLPVVDDEAERAEREADAAKADGIGAVRLEGDETPLRAEVRSDDQDDVADLPTSTSTHTQPWSAEERAEAIEDAEREANAHRDQEIASALRHLPSMAGSPLSFGSSPTGRTKPARLPSASLPLPMDQQTQGDAASFMSHESCEAEDQEMRHSIRRFLILCQSVCAPTFVTWAIVSSSGSPHIGLKVAVAAAVGALSALFSFWAMRRKDAGRARFSDRTLSAFAMIRCSMGFIVSVMWIMTIVDEVVSILQTVGIIVGLSDAILGLTVFAVGNSLGDLVANITIARLEHPVMAISACFAGPMLNLLLGIGISGTRLLSDGHGHWDHGGATDIYPIDFNPTLLVSGLGLLLILVGTLIAVPMNRFELTRPIGVSLIAAYGLIMTVNLLTEIFWVRGHTVL